ncbi:MAG TPA: hypothetical protein VGE29_09735 [Prosthecobacter sp.]
MKAGSYQIGEYYLLRQPKAEKRWKVPGVKEWEPNWIVDFRVPERAPVKESARLPICSKCLAADASPGVSRKDCECQAAVRVWAEKKLKEKVEAWKAGRVEEKTEKPLMLSEVVDVYRARGPKEKEHNIETLELIVKVTKDRPLSQVRVDELHPDDWDMWAWCAQEYYRRGYSQRGFDEPVGERGEWRVDGVGGTFSTRLDAVEASRLQRRPENAWELVRKAMPEHPEPDRKSVNPGNTTIISRMRDAKSILGEGSRDSYLKPIRHRLPDSVQKWWKTKIKIKVPDNRFSLSFDVYERMWTGLPLLKQDDPQAWALIRLHWTTGLRPVESRACRPSWLEVSAAGTPEEVVYLVIKNRPAEGYTMKDEDTLQVRAWPLPLDLVEMLPRIARSESLLGVVTPYQWDQVYRRANAWLRQCGVKGAQTLYNLRKLVATVKLAIEGADAAAAALGHADARTSLQYYAGTSGDIKALSDGDLSPVAVMGRQRLPFKLTMLWKEVHTA